jgi:anti-anti-sigma regulatory factor
LTIEIDLRGAVAILAPESARSLADLRTAAEQAVAGGAATLVVDLARAPHLSGEALEHLAGAAFVCEKERRGLALASASRETLRTLETIGLAHLFPYVYPDRGEALARLAAAAIAPPGEPPLEIGF